MESGSITLNILIVKEIVNRIFREDLVMKKLASIVVEEEIIDIGEFIKTFEKLKRENMEINHAENNS
jgi:hypothetical protein